jgi:hypothetical protein
LARKNGDQCEEERKNDVIVLDKCHICKRKLKEFYLENFNYRFCKPDCLERFIQGYSLFNGRV